MCFIDLTKDVDNGRLGDAMNEQATDAINNRKCLGVRFLFL